LDRTANKREFIKLPDEQIGLAFVFRVFPGISYALIARGTRAVEVGDRATNPSDDVDFAREEERMGISADRTRLSPPQERAKELGNMLQK
ncbi:MAG TPA: hypothetical protein VJU53_15250, partial [Burkholderiaceae bacterium]|nr:hypothetical protein [Burkholderiaceae bacterium]